MCHRLARSARSITRRLRQVRQTCFKYVRAIPLTLAATAAGRRDRASADGAQTFGAEERVHARRDPSAVGDRPDDERLTTRGIAGGEDLRDVGRTARRGDDVAAAVERQAEIGDQAFLLRADEAHRE